MAEGGAATHTVVLNSHPTGNATMDSEVRPEQALVVPARRHLDDGVSRRLGRNAPVATTHSKTRRSDFPQRPPFSPPSSGRSGA